jgi:Tfp pilus assembly protein PilF
MGTPAKVASGKTARSLSDYIARVRKLSESSRPIRPEIPVAELTDPALRASLASLAQSKTPERYWQVGESYRRLGVLDQAYDYLEQAVHLDAGYAPAWDSLARVWRDWGAPEFGLGDASRAVYFGSNVAAYKNTLGTVLVALGRFPEARQAFLSALTYEPNAAWALNNLCFVDMQQGRLADARAHCEAAVARAPEFRVARQNLVRTLAMISSPPAAVVSAPPAARRATATTPTP